MPQKLYGWQNLTYLLSGPAQKSFADLALKNLFYFSMVHY